MTLNDERFGLLLLAGALLCGAAVTRGKESSETTASVTSRIQQSPSGSAAGTSAHSAPSNGISNLLIQNLHDVFGQNDPKRRRAAIDQIFTEDCVFYDPMGGAYRGRDEIDRVAGAVRATHPDFRYQPISEPEEVGNGGRVQWVEGRAGEAPVRAGTDFIIARDGRITTIYLFFDKLP